MPAIVLNPEKEYEWASRFLDKLRVGCFCPWCTRGTCMEYGEDWEFVVQCCFVLTYGIETQKHVSCVLFFTSEMDDVKFEFQQP